MNKQDRVFAYTLAKTIDNDDLEKVSGGSIHWSHKTSMGPTGGSGAGIDATADISVDW